MKRILIFLLAIGFIPVYAAAPTPINRTPKADSMNSIKKHSSTKTFFYNGKFNWIKEVPNYIQYFKPLHQKVIRKIGIDRYLKLYESCGQSGIYLGVNFFKSKLEITKIIGQESYDKLFETTNGQGIYFYTIGSLKKAFVLNNNNMSVKECALIVDVTFKTIYRWRQGAKV